VFEEEGGLSEVVSVKSVERVQSDELAEPARRERPAREKTKEPEVPEPDERLAASRPDPTETPEASPEREEETVGRPSASKDSGFDAAESSDKEGSEEGGDTNGPAAVRTDAAEPPGPTSDPISEVTRDEPRPFPEGTETERPEPTDVSDETEPEQSGDFEARSEETPADSSTSSTAASSFDRAAAEGTEEERSPEETVDPIPQNVPEPEGSGRDTDGTIEPEIPSGEDTASKGDPLPRARPLSEPSTEPQTGRPEPPDTQAQSPSVEVRIGTIEIRGEESESSSTPSTPPRETGPKGFDEYAAKRRYES
jgi:hypothetical protein